MHIPFTRQRSNLLSLLLLFITFEQARADMPKGRLVAFDGMNAVGYACDPDDLNATVKVHLYGKAAAGEPHNDYVTEARADLNTFREISETDCGPGAHGFSLFLPGPKRDAGTPLYVYAIDLTANSYNPMLTGSGMGVVNRAFGGIEATNSHQVAGWACDWDARDQPLYVDFYDAPKEFGNLIGQALANQPSSAWANSSCDGSPHGFLFSVPTQPNPSLPLTIYAYAHNADFVGAPLPLEHSPAHLGVNYGAGKAPELLSPLVRTAEPSISLFPNQLMGNRWYKPKPEGSWVNGHFEQSFGDFNRWIGALNKLSTYGGMIATSAAEVGYLSNSTINALRMQNIGYSIETPSFTQCLDGKVLGELDFLGKTPQCVKNQEVDGCRVNDLFCSIFTLPAYLPDRRNPLKAGWFVTHDGTSFVPEQIIMDERLPNLLPSFQIKLQDPNYPNDTTKKFDVLAESSGTWGERKKKAREAALQFEQKGGCVAAAKEFNAGDLLVNGFIKDYVEYVQVMQRKWPKGGAIKTPALAIHWNVNSWWEWQDEACLDQRHAEDPLFYSGVDDLYRLKRPCHNNVRYLRELLTLLCEQESCPSAVYMDVDWNFNTHYNTENLKKLKNMIRDFEFPEKKYPVKFGVNLVAKECPKEEPHCVYVYDAPSKTVERVECGNSNDNVCAEQTLLQLATYLNHQGIYDPDVVIRVGSWTSLPKEVGPQVSQTQSGSLPHVFQRLMTEVFNR